MEPYITIEGTATAEIEEKKSRFISNICHVETPEEAAAFLESIRTLHRDARHNVHAYVLLANNAERCSDDGEPQKTSGLPTLQVIKHAGLKDVIIVTTRYFGGTLLGTGGLVRAYTDAANAAVAAANKVTIQPCVDISLTVPYHLYDKVNYLIGLAPTKILSTDFTSVVSLTIRMVDGTQADLLQTLTGALQGQGVLACGDPYFTAF